MRLNNNRVRKNRKKFLQAINVIGLFQNPTPFLRIELQVLQKPLLPQVNGSKIARAQETFVSWNSRGGDEFLRKQCVTMNGHALVRRAGTHRINGIRALCQSTKPPESPRCHARPRVASSRTRYGYREHDLPHARNSVSRVLG